MSTTPTRIYLASQSPRRRELLKQIDIRFDLLLMRSALGRPLDVDESTRPDESPEIYVQRLSREKACAGFDTLVKRNLLKHPVLAADTTVTLDGKIFGKPDNAGQAAQMLRELSGREHQVLTAVAIAQDEQVEVLLSVSMVKFAKLSEERIRRYLQSHEYTDKAGSYAIQGQAGAFVEQLTGSYSGVMGLPLFETVQLLQRFGYPAP